MSWYSEIVETDRLTRRFYARETLRDKPAALRDAYLRSARQWTFRHNLEKMTASKENSLERLMRVAGGFGAHSSSVTPL